MVLERLRRETREQHEQIDSRLALSGPDLTLPHYLRVLQTMLAFFEPWERALSDFAHTGTLPGELQELWRSGPRAHKLHADLARLGSAPDPALSTSAPAPQNLGEWLGSLYVLEGSRLGGQFIARAVEERFGWSSGDGYSFFAGQPKAVGQRWRAVCAALEAHAGLDNEMAFAAHRTFASLQRIVDVSMRS